MKLRFYFSTFLVLLYLTVEIIAVPIGNSTEDDDTDTISVPSSEEDDTDTVSSGVSSSEEYEDYSEEEEYVIIDDMIIRSNPSRAGLVDASWPDGVVPFSYAFSLAPSQKDQIKQAMAEIHEAVPCVSFRQVTKEDTYNIEFRNDAMNQGCSSYVGWQNRKNQPIQLAAICSKGNAIHEIMHALGFFHEQTRNDRDTYVTVKMENVQPGTEGNFRKDGEQYQNAETTYFGIPYNYDSIMHYGKNYFSKNGQNTIEPLYTEGALGNGDNIGQREYISEGDVQMMRAKYNCSVPDNAGEETNPTFLPTSTEQSVTENSTGDGETEEGEETEAATKPTTKNPICQINPSMCKPS